MKISSFENKWLITLLDERACDILLVDKDDQSSDVRKLSISLVTVPVRLRLTKSLWREFSMSSSLWIFSASITPWTSFLATTTAVTPAVAIAAVPIAVPIKIGVLMMNRSILVPRSNSKSLYA